MSVEKLERVMWRVRKLNPNKNVVTIPSLRRAIMLEIGTDPRTYYANKRALVDLGWIKSEGRSRHVTLTNNDLTEV